ncbi:MAG: peptidyl-prolyl cis-trans isomerase [Planctomycetota bacterium]
MSEPQLDLRVPELAPRRAPAGRGTVVLTVLGLLILAGLAVNIGLTLVACPVVPASGEAGGRGGPNAAAEQALALDLEERGLPELAARAWERCLAAGPTEPVHAVLFRIGENYYKAGRWSDALDAFLRAEKADTGGTVKAGPRVQACLEALGSYSALKNDRLQRTAVGDAAAQPAVAEVAGCVITNADVDRAVEAQVTMQMAALAGRVPPEVFFARKKQYIESVLNEPGARQRFTEQLVMDRLLARAAADAGFKPTGDEEETVATVRRQLTGDRFLKQEILSRIHVTEADIQTWFRANAEAFKTPARLKVSVVTAADKAATDALAAAVGGDAAGFAARVAAEPLNKDLKDWISTDAPIPGLGLSPAAAGLGGDDAAPGMVKGPVEAQGRFALIRVDDRQPGKVPAYEEVRAAAAERYYTQKYADTERTLLQELQAKYGVRIMATGTAQDAPAP